MKKKGSMLLGLLGPSKPSYEDDEEHDDEGDDSEWGEHLAEKLCDAVEARDYAEVCRCLRDLVDHRRPIDDCDD